MLAKDLLTALERLTQGESNSDDVALIQNALATGQISIGGDVNRSVIITGSENLIANITPEIRSQLLRTPYDPLSLPPEETLPDPGLLPPGSRLPFTRNVLFTGRIAPLRALAEFLLYKQHQSTLVTQVIDGMGGIGKTQLTIEFAYRYGRFFYGVHWLNAANPADLKTEIAVCGQAMTLRPWPDSLEKQVVETLTAWKQSGPRLVILDNLERIGDARQWLPELQNSNIRLIVTSRQSDWPNDLYLQSLSLAVLTPDESRVFLRKYLPPRRVKDATVDTLAERLGHLPLALELAGRYMCRVKGLSVEKYIRELDEVLEHPSMKRWREDLGSPTKHDLDLGATFSLSWNRIRNTNAIRLCIACGYCAPNELIPRKLLRTAGKLSVVDYDEGISLLVGAGLLKDGPAIHPLLADFARAQDRDNSILTTIAEAMLDLATKANQSGLPARMIPLRLHLRAVTENAEKEGIDIAAELWNEFGNHQLLVADYAGAEAAYRRALKVDETTFGPNHPSVAVDVNNLGNALRALADLQGARAAFERALNIDEMTFGSDHPKVAIRTYNLGNVLRDLGDFQAAKSAYERSLRIDQGVFGLAHPKIAIRLIGLGSVMRDLGDLQKARVTYEQALLIDKSAFGSNHPRIATAINNLGNVLRDLGDLPGAKDAYRHALQIDVRAFGLDHPKIAIRINNLGTVLQGLGDMPGAKAAFERALQIFEKCLPEDHPSIRVVKNNLQLLEEEKNNSANPYKIK